MYVKDYMSKSIISVSPGDTAEGAWRKIIQEHIRQVPVVEDGSLKGILSRTDLLRDTSPTSGEESLDERLSPSVTEVMTSNPITVGPGETIEDAAETMYSNRIGCLPVVTDDGSIVGILTRTDLFRALIEIIGIGSENVRMEYDHDEYEQLLDKADELSEEMEPLSTLIFQSTGPKKWKSLFRFQS